MLKTILHAAAFLPVVALFVIVGCAPMDRAVYDNENRQPTSSIDIYKDGNKPDRKYKIITELSMPGHRDNELLRQNQIAEEAKRIGGNGLIFSAHPTGGWTFGVAEWVFNGKVIVYQ